MAYPTIAADLLQALNVHSHSASQVTFNLIVPVDELPQLSHFSLVEIPDPRVRVYFYLAQDLIASGTSDPVNVGQTDLDPLVARQVNPCDSWHIKYLLTVPISVCLTVVSRLFSASLSLFVLRILTDYVYHPLAPDNLALGTAPLHRWCYFHEYPPESSSDEKGNRPLDSSPHPPSGPATLFARLSSEPPNQLLVSTPQQSQVLTIGSSSPLAPGEVAHNFGHPRRVFRPQLPLQQLQSLIRI
jgi:hypothetical protein